MALDPECAAYLSKSAEWMAANALPPFWEMPPERARQTYRTSILDSKPPMAPMDLVEDRMIETRGGERRIRILRPPTAGDPLPAMLYLHSGGYVIGGIDESEQEARRFAALTPAVVISASYRLAPEHPAPAAAEDAWDALQWVRHHAAEYGGNSDQLIVGGCSAGGGLAAVLARRTAQVGAPRISLAVLLCPWLDLTMSQASIDRFAKGYDLDREFLDWFVAAATDPACRSDDPLVSPLLHPVPAGHPPTVVLAAECDPLVDEARLYAERLRKAGAIVQLVDAPGMIHAFNEITHLIPAGESCLDALHAAIQAGLGHQ